jgi:hypothetical protein
VKMMLVLLRSMRLFPDDVSAAGDGKWL